MSQFPYDLYTLTRLRQQELLREAADDRIANQLGHPYRTAGRASLPSPRATFKTLARLFSRPSAAGAT